MLSFLIQRPIAVLTTFFGLLILGLVVLQVLPISLLPKIPIPQITVQISQPNTTVRELENTVVRPLRNQLLQLGNLKDIQSRCRNSSATILLTFNFGTNTNLAFIEVNEQIDQLMGSLPRELARPQVLKANAADIPVLQLIVFPKDIARQSPLELAYFTKTVLKRRIEQLSSVAFVDRSGYVEPEIRLVPRQNQLQSLQLIEEDIVRILRENNVELGSVLVQDGQYQYNIRFLSALQSVEDLQQIYFNHKGRIFPLKEIVNIQLQPKQRRGTYIFNQQAAIVFNVHKQADAQLFTLKKDFQELLESLRIDYPTLSFEIANDQSELLSVSIQNLHSSLLYGAAFAFLVLFIFFREWLAPFLIGLVIPSSLLITLLGFYLGNLSINIISLSGLILGMGLMIDNSIIIIENIRQYRLMGYAVDDACVQGANEVIRPLISSALTTCAVFMPLLLLSGIGGTLFYDQAVSISISLFVSLLIAYILLPTLIRLLSKKRKVKYNQQEDVVLRRMTSPSDKTIPFDGEVIREEQLSSFYTFQPTLYSKTVDIVIGYPYLFIAMFLILTFLMGKQILQLPKETFPQLSKKAIGVKIDWNKPISLVANEKRIQHLLDHSGKSIEKSYAMIGASQFLLEAERQRINESKVVIYPTKDLATLANTIQQYFQKSYPTANVTIAPIKNIFDELFGSDKALLTAYLQSTNGLETPTIEQVQSFLAYLQEAKITHTIPTTEQVYKVAILKEQALLLGVDYQTIYNQLKTLFNQHQVSTLRTSDIYIPINLGSQTSDFYTAIQSVMVRNKEGQAIPLSNFIQLSVEEDYKVLTAGKTGENLTIELDTFSQSLLKTIKENIPNEAKWIISFSSQVFDNEQNIRELSTILFIVILLLYLILSAQFESLLLPFIVMLTVPISIAGSIFTLYLMHQSLNLISIIGLIVLSGIVVNDAILKLTMMQQLQVHHTLREAIHIAGQRRLKPIIMTSLTTILALLPILFSEGLGAELQQPLTYAVIGGMVVGTLSSLYFVPLVYWLLKKRSFIFLTDDSLGI